MTTYTLAQTQSGNAISLLSKMANRHGLIAGATGTGKTVTLRTLAENFSNDGIPVFLVDVKGDISGLSQAGTMQGKVAERVNQFNLSSESYFSSFPVSFWDVFGETGIPLRTTISELGPVLLSRLLNLNDTQEGLLNLVFRVADDKGLLLIDLKDLRAMLQYVGENAKTFRMEYGNVSVASIGAIQRALLSLENEGGDKLFGEPSLNLDDWLQTRDDKGVINILNSEKLINSPTLYSAFLLWLMSELFENLPEIGDPEKPKFVMFFDEAHLIFDDAPKALVDKVEQVVRLIRSKGVGIYFVTQNPLDLPDSILGQLGNRIQHALRAFTPRDQKAVKAAAETFRSNPNIDVASAITELGIGDALISVLDEKGMPTPVEIASIYPPKSQLSPLSHNERHQYVKQDDLFDYYNNYVDEHSAYEELKQQADVEQQQIKEEQEESEGLLGGIIASIFGKKKRREQNATEQMVSGITKAVGRNIRNRIAREIVRGVLGAMKK
ncbi:Ornithine/acetylornithine aminotransferase [Phocoenobacter uteri]|uniref:Ornithine/acetylornithine aminotransferase n=1 Tax=Phocoenobacter uteri TaxID=146806 RepID=A0A379CBK0_9PAST|nr:helicase HerA-like domain-containing protein [Phocoenobacter uteri]MDG6881029.1 ATP-binding protein [Phocoenobacter uteri]SUB59047.1 Ornithine/acetylornithine aminotransferase [Phocoenobacter uteri]